MVKAAGENLPWREWLLNNRSFTFHDIDEWLSIEAKSVFLSMANEFFETNTGSIKEFDDEKVKVMEHGFFLGLCFMAMLSGIEEANK